jgi:HK97 family phage portal protein
MLPLNPDTVSIELRKGAFDWRYKVANGDGTFRYLARTDVFHLRGLSFDGVQGISPIMAAKQALGLALAAESYGARFFENDAQPGGWIEYPGQFKDQNAKKEFRDSWRRSQSGRNRGKTAVLEFGMKYHELAVNNEEAQFLETRKMQIAEIARLFRVPPHMIGDLDRATNNNIEQQSLDFILYSLSPWIARWKAAIRSTFLVGTPDEDLQIDFPVTALLRGDLAARSTFYQSGITNGWLTRNEARLDDDRDPIDGLDEPLVPLNMATPEQAAEQLKQQSKPTAPKQPVDTPKGDDARAIALAQAAAERIARKESRMVQAEYAAMRKDGVDMKSVGDRFKRMSVLYQAHVQFVSDALDVLPEAARLYCEQQALSASFDMQIVDFECLTRSRCERLALKGTL